MPDIKHAELMLRMAEMDLQAVENMQDPQQFADSVFGFHVQQAAEKLLKAWLSLAGTVYPRTHDLRLLLDLLADQDDIDIPALDDLDDLNDYGVQFRYDAPLDLEPLDRATFIARLTVLHDLVRERLDSAG